MVNYTPPVQPPAISQQQETNVNLQQQTPQTPQTPQQEGQEGQESGENTQPSGTTLDADSTGQQKASVSTEVGSGPHGDPPPPPSSGS